MGMFQFVTPPLPHFVECGDKTYLVGGRHPNRSHIGVFDLIVVTQGAHFIVEEETAYHVPAGKFLILRPDRSHYTLEPCREETHAYWLHFQTHGAWSHLEEGEPSISSKPIYLDIKDFSCYLPRTKTLCSPDKVHSIFKELITLQAESSPFFRWKQQQLFLDLLLCLQEQAGMLSISPQLQLAEQAAAYMRQHYQEAVSYKEMSDALHFHANYIAICMKKSFGCTPLEFLTRYRVEQAKKLLIITNDPIGKIAETTGFRSFPYFVRCFSRYTGMKPMSFRQQYR
ncbi:MAG: AraC family transcriptional regulator [Paenibacillus sp.]|jgi:AraC-like DNA-binding protein|nr:AraC family transcriptional regulator [Paenibacillus sp.]